VPLKEVREIRREVSLASPTSLEVLAPKLARSLNSILVLAFFFRVVIRYRPKQFVPKYSITSIERTRRRLGNPEDIAPVESVHEVVYGILMAV
jgi:hypothetical protein